MPATWLNYAVGLTRVRAGIFAIANALGALPRTFIYAGLGGSLTHATPLLTTLSIALFVALGVAGALVALTERRALGADARP